MARELWTLNWGVGGSGRTVLMSRLAFLFIFPASCCERRSGSPFFALLPFCGLQQQLKVCNTFFSLFRMLLFAYLMAGHRQNGAAYFFSGLLGTAPPPMPLWLGVDLWARRVPLAVASRVYLRLGKCGQRGYLFVFWFLFSLFCTLLM